MSRFHFHYLTVNMPGLRLLGDMLGQLSNLVSGQILRASAMTDNSSILAANLFTLHV